jgi:hypothetical protein
MKKLIAIALLAFASSAAFAVGVSPAVSNNDVAPIADVSTSAAAAPVTAPAPSALEKGATKVGSVLGGMFRTTVKLGQAVGKGVREGLADDGTKPPVLKGDWQTSSRTSANAHPTVLDSLASNPVTHRLAAMVKRNKDQPAAPIEERSMLASNPN